MRYIPVRDTSEMTEAQRNDNLRQYLPGCLPRPHRCEISQGMCHLPEQDIDEILYAVADFSDFDPTESIADRHDFGRFQVKGYAVVWRFLYFDENWQLIKSNGTRLLQVMLAEEFDLLS